jgi:type 1 fimbria pilin
MGKQVAPAKFVRKATHLALALVGLIGGGLTGCGQTDYFAVAVTVASNVSSGDLQQIAQCEVMTSGAVSDQTDFVLNYSVCGPDTNYTGLEKDSNGDNVLGTFEYGTTKTSGQVHFKILLKDGSRNTIGMGETDANVGSGVVPVTLKITDTSGL